MQRTLPSPSDVAQLRLLTTNSKQKRAATPHQQRNRGSHTPVRPGNSRLNWQLLNTRARERLTISTRSDGSTASFKHLDHSRSASAAKWRSNRSLSVDRPSDEHERGF